MEELSTPEAPASIGPFSQGIVDGDQIYVSGQGPVDPSTGEVIKANDIKTQTKRTLDNIEAVLAAGGATLDDVVKTTIFVQSMDSYDEVNSVYDEVFESPFPARSAIEVSDLPIDIDVEIEAIAHVPE